MIVTSTEVILSVEFNNKVSRIATKRKFVGSCLTLWRPVWIKRFAPNPQGRTWLWVSITLVPKAVMLTF